MLFVLVNGSVDQNVGWFSCWWVHVMFVLCFNFCYGMWVQEITITGDFLQTSLSTKTVQPISANCNKLETFYINKWHNYHRKISNIGHLLITPKMLFLIKICSTQIFLTRRSQRNETMRTLPTQRIGLQQKIIHKGKDKTNFQTPNNTRIRTAFLTKIR